MGEANYEKRTAYFLEQLAKGEHPLQKAAKHATRKRSPYVSPVSEEEKVFIPDIVDIADANIDPKTQTRRKRKIYKKLQELQEAKDKLAKLYSHKLKKEKDTLYRKIATKAGVKQLTQDKKKIIENAIEKASVSGEVDEEDLIEKLQDDLYTRFRKRAGLKTLHYTKKRLIDNALERASVSGEVDEDDLVRILKLPVDHKIPFPKPRVTLSARKTVTKKVNKSAKIPAKKLVLKRKSISPKFSTSSSPNIRKKPTKKVLQSKTASRKLSTSNSSPNTRRKPSKSAYRKPSSDSSD
jgi:transcription initiation factor IIF auxiliary subunit